MVLTIKMKCVAQLTVQRDADTNDNNTGDKCINSLALKLDI